MPFDATTVRRRGASCRAALPGAIASGIAVVFVDLVASRPAEAGSSRSVILVPLPSEPSWQDMAFLAAVAASTVASGGEPAVVSLAESGEVSGELADYLRRYRPNVVYRVGGTAPAPAGGPACRVLGGATPDAAAGGLAAELVGKSASAVVCRDDDYAAGLVASALAARLRAPLLFHGERGLSAGASRALRRLGTREVVAVGDVGKVAGALGRLRARVTGLADAEAVLAWMSKRGLPVSYLAAVNPKDRARTVVKKLSLAGPLLAAAREGMVVPLAYETRWKVGFTGKPLGKDEAAPKGVPASKAPPRVGRIDLDGHDYGFVLTGKPRERGLRLNIDLDGNGTYADAGAEGQAPSKVRPALTGVDHRGQALLDHARDEERRGQGRCAADVAVRGARSR